MRYDPNDADVKEFIRTTRLTTYSLISEVLEATYGRERAWPVVMIRAERAQLVRLGRRDRYSDKVPIMAFLRDHMDLTSLDDLVTQGKATFGHFPSRSQVYRMIQNLRVEAIQAAGATMTRQRR